ncbi:Mucin-associated surface protein (MASP) [Trypanosoma cruzi]|uniref:Mucin-associated surface protein (MASP), putative n=2 Tax=Trypanosoma cruzi TaxID=5693 RepID=Q4DCY8_TRYCC|nr:mucin-associated surface protein (MASP), putative [Trypanosoma cruzi]EAN90391.1 mucin-associated surface protein (MASP), putative [Trypanosoma cruzi]PWV06544.1 Mucin-associated surface protein (MASP) [Trypanosoma cruzi]|eukprot:XP_812242.1 mucin-associated surface protein (MASP) [Trypanosoma cruzi strain CL Brener]
MAMMMTGRVLLVCTLCVLWCGVFGIAVNDAGGVSDGSEFEYLFLNWKELLKNECEAENSNEKNLSSKNLAVNCCVHRAMHELCKGVYSNLFMETEFPNVEGVCKKYAEKPDEVKCPKQQTQLSPVTENSVKVSVPEALGNEGDLGKTPEEAPLADPPAKPTKGPLSSPVGGQPANADDVPVPNSEKSPVSTKSTNDSREGDTETITDTDQEETSTSEAESATPTPPVASDNDDSNEKDTDTGEEVPNNAPESDGAETQEEKQDENKEANPKETPGEATATKTTTPMTGNSDGGTAVSHSTSPLLLLVVACAAAAAVVAA